MKTQSAKAKGRRLQQKIRQDILDAYPALEEDDVSSTSMGASGEDIQLSAAGKRAFPFSVEAKNQERLNIWAALAQADGNCPAGCDPIVVFSKNRSDTYVALKWPRFMQLLAPAPPEERSRDDWDALVALVQRLDAQRKQAQKNDG